MVDVELFYIEILPVWTYFSCIYECIFKMFEKIKKVNCVKRVFIFIFTEFICKDFINKILFFPFLQFFLHWKYCYNHFTIMCICFTYLVFLRISMCSELIGYFYQKVSFPLLYASWSWPNDWEVIITKWKKWIKPIHRTNFLWGGGLMLIAGLSFQLEYHSNCSKMDLPFINEGCWRKYWFTKDL